MKIRKTAERYTKKMFLEKLATNRQRVGQRLRLCQNIVVGFESFRMVPPKCNLVTIRIFELNMAERGERKSLFRRRIFVIL